MKHFRSTDKRLKSLSILPTVAVCFLCWVLCYAAANAFPPVEEKASTTSMWLFLGRLINNNRMVASFTGIFILLLVACVIQRISDTEVLIRERTRLPFMLYLLLISTNAGLLPVREVSVVLICFAFALRELFSAYQSPQSKGNFFNIGLLTGIAGLFMPQSLWLLPLFWIGMYQFRSLNTVSFAASLTGVAIIYWFVLAWCVWKHDFLIFRPFYDGLTDFGWLSDGIYYRVESIVILIVFTMAFFHIKAEAYNNSLRVRRILSFLLNAAVWIFVLILLYGKDTDSFLAVIYIPLSVIIASFLENLRRMFRFILYYFILSVCLTSFLLRIWIY
ncbi:MAG: DUF6427 family protein [Tannerella sp.]|jgi:hypothetical protein|nr:DUF6427 family protein [Tannerella sp.]